MLSNNMGWRKRRRGAHLSGTSRSAQVCPAILKCGKCTTFNFEQNLRKQLANEKESELRQKAADLLAAAEGTGDFGTPTSLSTRIVTDSDPSLATPLPTLGQVVESLKREKAYLNWSLDIAVEQRLVQLRRHRCMYSHVTNAMSTDEGTCAKFPVGDSSPLQKHIFIVDPVLAQMTPLQRLILLILRKQTLRVPRELLNSRREEAAEELGDVGSEEDADRATKDRTDDDFVNLSVYDRDDGIVDLSSLPRIAPYVVQHASQVLLHRAVAQSGGVTQQPLSDADRRRLWSGFAWHKIVSACGEKSTNDTGSSAHPLYPITEKEVDLAGTSVSAQRLAEVLEFFLTEERTQSGSGVLLQSLALRRCNITNADHLLSCLKKHSFHTSLRALDLSYNDIESLRFLFLLRSTFSEQLLFLSLRDNPITMKPDFREQVKRTLPNIVSLDGIKIRSKPLGLPYPKGSVFCEDAVSSTDVADVMDAVGELFHAWETRRVSIPSDDGEATHEQSLLSIEIDEKTFAARYFSPNLCFSLTTAAGCSWFDSDRMRLKTEVEMDAEFDGFRLSAIDMKELQVMDVCMRNASRSLTAGRAAIHRTTTGQFQCFTAYMSTLYPQRFGVDHHFTSSRVSITKLPAITVEAPLTSLSSSKKGDIARKKRSTEEKGTLPQGGPLFASAAREPRKKPTVYVVTIHGAMSWRTPSMNDGEYIMCAVDRTMTFVKAPRWGASAANVFGSATDSTAVAMAAVERHHREMTLSNEVMQKYESKRMLLATDAVHLRPMPQDPQRHAWCEARREEFVSRLAFEYGALRHKQLIRSVVERSTSDASVHATLERLFPPSPSTTCDRPEDQEKETTIIRREASLQLPPGSLLLRQEKVYDLSGLSGVRGMIDQVALFHKQLDCCGWAAAGNISRSPSELRQVTLADLDEMISFSNGDYTLW